MKNAHYAVLDAIKKHFREKDQIINSVRFGSILELDQEKVSQFPLAIFDVNTVTTERGALEFNIVVGVADIVDKAKENESVDEFYGATNLHDVYNDMLVSAVLLQDSLKRGDLYDQGFHLVQDRYTYEAFKNRFESEVAGWIVQFKVTIANGLTIC